MSYQKNDILTLRITDMGLGGEGIGKTEDGYTLFVKDTVTGDLAEIKIIKAKKQYGYGRLMNLIEASAKRCEPFCENARACGGCQLQALSYKEQLLWKQEKVRNNLIRIGGFEDPEVQPTIGMENPVRYRNKAQFPIGSDKEGNPVTGFYAGRTHSIIPCTDCQLGAAGNEPILTAVLDWMKENRISAYNETTGKGLVRHCLIRHGHSTGQWMVCLVINGSKLPKSEKLVAKLKSMEGMTSITFSPNTRRDNVIMGDSIVPLWGEGWIQDTIGSIRYQISPLSFYQVNPVQTEKLYAKALEYADLTGDETVWDLYCGIGTISLFLAQKAKKVYGVEIVPQAIDDARVNAALNGMDNAEFFVGKAEEVLPHLYKTQNVYADVIVVDPPRKGCDESLLDTMIQMAPKRIVYVSCDSATLARDLKILCSNGYKLEKVQPVDQFPHTVHVET
ncbi:MAG: 23S rRNA (uracil(1939)-C(5))-methyltransferase RlmD, partial [Lachnospiraceae bacterium]|nr:23S rRNA (uracil(1939)-C(5))-methyltransferase RlmD [Lachnospiraceae bacterium]